MKRVALIILFVICATSARPQLFVPSGVRFSKTAPSNVFTAASANGRYEVTVEETGLNSLTASHIPLVATMLKVESNSRTPLWTAKFPGWQVQHFISSDILVSDDGDFFVQTRGVSSTATLFRQDASFPLNLPNNLDFFLSFQEKYILLDQLNGQKIVRFWNRSKNSWEVVNATTGQKFTNTIPNEVIAKWMEAQRREIIDRIYAAKREMLRRKVAESSPALGKLAANAMSQTANVVVTEGDYEFLTLQRHPEDRHWLEELFAYDDDSFSSFPFITPSSFYGGSAEKEGSLADFVQTDFISARVDRLLGIWDKKVSESAPPGMIGQADESKLTRYHLGKVFGRVQFSLPINVFTSLPKPPPAPGPMIHILLIPADRATSAASPITTESIDASLSVYRDRLAEVADSVTFAFTTVRTGTYQLKAIWDKRAPYNATNSAGPGDYESVLSAPIHVTSGSIARDIVLQCTNRVTGGEAYYAADETLRRKTKVTGEISTHTFTPDKDGRLDTFWRNAAYWITSTNQAPSTNWAHIESIGTTTFGRVKGSEIARPDRLVIVLRRNSKGDPLSAECPKSIRIFDEHNCSYKEFFSEKTDGGFRFVFFQFPRSARTWRVVGYNWAGNSRRLDENIFFDYTVTNLVRIPAHEVHLTSIPADIDLGSATLRVKSVTGSYIEPTIDAEFLEKGQPAKDWRIREAIVSDADGNLINPLEICRAQKTMTIVGRAAASESSPAIPFQFTIERPPSERK